MGCVWFMCEVVVLVLLCETVKLNEMYVYILKIQLYEKLLYSYCEKICAVFIPGKIQPASSPSGKCILDSRNT